MEALSPFDPDPEIPDIALPGEAPMNDDPFFSTDGAPFDPFDPSLSATRPRRSFPWKIVGLAIAVAALLGAVALGAVWILNGGVTGLIERPSQVVERYYDALQRSDFEVMAKCLDPESVAPDNILPLAEKAAGALNNLASERLGLNIKVRWQFIDLKYKTLEETRDAAKVDVSGKLRIWEESTNIGPTVPYQHTHQVVKRNGHWYLQP